MEITRDDLDPVIADLVTKRAVDVPAGTSVRPGVTISALTGGCGAFIVWAIASLFLAIALNGGFAGYLFSLFVSGAILGWLWWAAEKFGRTRRQRKPKRITARRARRFWRPALVSSDALRVLSGRASLSAAERAYCSTLALLAESDSVRTGLNPETLRADLLQPLAALLEKSRDLSKKEQEVIRALGDTSVQKLTIEQRALQKRRDAVQGDDITREAADQALAMNESRLADAHAFEQMRERLAVRQEAIAQTLASVASSLARASLSGVEDGRGGARPDDASVLAAPGVAEINEAVRAIAGQTQAVARAEAELRGVHS